MFDIDGLVSAARGADAQGRAEALDALVRALYDGDDLVRAEAADALGPLGHHPACAGLGQLLAHDPDATVLAAAAESLGDLGDPVRLPAVFDAVRGDPDEAVRAHAAATLGLLGAADETLRSAHDAELSPWVRGELGFARYRRGGVSMRQALAPFEGAPSLLGERLLNDLLERSPVRVTNVDAALVDECLAALVRRLAHLDGHVRLVRARWLRTGTS